MSVGVATPTTLIYQILNRLKITFRMLKGFFKPFRITITLLFLLLYFNSLTKNRNITKLKRAYSQLNQVMKLIDDEHGLSVLSGNPKDFVPKYILPHYNNATLYLPSNSQIYGSALCFNPNKYYLPRGEGSVYTLVPLIMV